MKKSAKDAKERLFLVAKGQAGIFTARQAELAGFHSSHHSYHVRVGNWHREFKGIFRLRHFPMSEQSTMFLWLLWSTGRGRHATGVYSHQTALKLHGLVDFALTKLYMTVPRKFRRNAAIPSPLILSYGDISPDEVQNINGVLVTTPIRTILDLVLEGKVPEEELSAAFLNAKDRGLITDKDVELHRDLLVTLLHRNQTSVSLREDKFGSSSLYSSDASRRTELLGRFLITRAEQLANYLRGVIQRGELVDPLPGIRSWSLQLGVSRDHLASALRVLKKEGLLEIGRRGVRLNSSKLRERRDTSRKRTRVVRFIYFGLPTLHEDLDWIAVLSESLHRHGIQLILEHCDSKRLRALTKRPKTPFEMLVLNAVPETYQEPFAQQGCSLLIGLPLVSHLPYITVDQEGAVRHATQHLLRQGFVDLDFLNIPSTVGNHLAGVFESTCKLWPHQPVKFHSVHLPRDVASFRTGVQRYVQRIRENRGILIYSPLPLALIQTALLQRGFQMPNQIQLVSLFHSAASVQVQPPPRYYTLPRPRLLKTIKAVILNYFETGNISAIRKILPVGVERPV